MKNILLTLIFVLNLSIGFSQVKKILIQPLGNVSPSITNLIAKSISDFYGFKTEILKPVKPTDDLYAPSKTRYSANKILRKFNGPTNKIVITNFDITTNKGNNNEWGVFGLGLQPGKICVVSTFRLKKNVSNTKFQQRLIKVVLHEVGHNLGLNHCDNDKKCLMNDAKGTSKQVDNEKVWICNKCSQKINLKK
jgi:archaemetzincin